MLQQTASGAEPRSDCLETEMPHSKLQIERHYGLELRDTEGIDEFVEALSTRSTLEHLTLSGYGNGPTYEDFEFQWT